MQYLLQLHMQQHATGAYERFLNGGWSNMKLFKFKSVTLTKKKNYIMEVT